MDVDTPPAHGQSHASQKQSVLPEVEVFCYLLVTIYLIDQKQLEEVHILYPGRSPVFTVSYLSSLSREPLNFDLLPRQQWYKPMKIVLKLCLAFSITVVASRLCGDMFKRIDYWVLLC